MLMHGTVSHLGLVLSFQPQSNMNKLFVRGENNLRAGDLLLTVVVFLLIGGLLNYILDVA